MVKSLLCKHEPRSENGCEKTEILFGLKSGEAVWKTGWHCPQQDFSGVPPGIESLPAGT